jgi:fluoride exporter
MNPTVALPLMPAVLAVFVGAGLGGCLRFALGETMNRWLVPMPLGTLAANLLGGYLVGLAIAFFTWRSDLSALWRLATITGFLGGLTTFSTFSAEVVHALMRGEPGWALATAATHLGGSLLLTALGIWTVRALLN